MLTTLIFISLVDPSPSLAAEFKGIHSLTQVDDSESIEFRLTEIDNFSYSGNLHDTGITAVAPIRLGVGVCDHYLLKGDVNMEIQRRCREVRDSWGIQVKKGQKVQGKALRSVRLSAGDLERALNRIWHPEPPEHRVHLGPTIWLIAKNHNRAFGTNQLFAYAQISPQHLFDGMSFGEEVSVDKILEPEHAKLVAKVEVDVASKGPPPPPGPVEQLVNWITKRSLEGVMQSPLCVF